MIKRLLLPLLLFAISIAHAETIKTDVLVVGGGPSGVAAAIQCAHSKVKTMLVEQGPWLGGSITMGGMCILDANRNLPSGIWGEFRRKITDHYRLRLGYDTSRNAILRFEPSIAAEILKKWTDTVKNLTVKLNTPFTSIKKDGTGWDVGITANGQTVTIEAKVLIDATETGDVAERAGVQFSTGFESRSETAEPQAPEKALPQIEDITWIAILKDFGRKADMTIAKPEGYDAALYTCLKGKDIKEMLKAGSLPNDKIMLKWGECGNQYPVSPADLEPSNRGLFYKKARLHTLGLVYYLQTELGYKNLGMADEFGTPDHLPYIPYIREYHRAKGMIRMDLNSTYAPYENDLKLYRTSIAVGDATPGQHYSDRQVPRVNYPPLHAYTIPMGAVVVKDAENLLVTEKAMSVTHLVNASTMYPSVQMCIGQGTGTVAAYCAFFKTTTKHLNVRMIQGELLDYKGYLLPITDITQTDPHFRAVQQVCATGLLKGIEHKSGDIIEIRFEPGDTVRTADVSPVLNELYTRAFLWFGREKPGETFTIGNLVSFISDYTLTEPKTLEMMLQKAWKTQFKLPGEMDMKRPCTKLEFAVLANRYLNTFSKRVDITGKFVN